jgi:hypothetical protein
MAGRARNDKLSMQRRKRIGRDEQSAVGSARERCDLVLDLARAGDEGADRLDFEFGRDIGEHREIILIMRRDLRVHHEGDARERRRNLFQDSEPFADHRRLEKHEPRDVAARTRKARDISRGNRIRHADEDDRDRAGLAR